ncbi:MAG: protein kinase [Pirellulaceae bacterium]|nr:MAG: protein kinase [Pirellulaceae bacterium]
MHPNIVTAFDAGSFGQEHYLVMELVEGELLSRLVRVAGPLSTGEAVHVLEQVANALAYAHQRGIIHRDIKPGNLMLTREGLVKVLDFGLAQFSASAKKQEGGRIFMGTPEYMSPEQIENAEGVDPRSDLYSLGATLFFLLTGRPMFSGDKLQVARAQLHQKPPPLFVVRPEVDLRLDAVFQKLVAKEPQDRYGSAQELLEALRELNLTRHSFSPGASLLPSPRATVETASTSVAADRSTMTRPATILAIDLGMVASTAAVYDPAVGPHVLAIEGGQAKPVRNIIWNDGNRVRFGADAAALRQSHPDRIVHSFQRWIGLRELQRPFLGRTVPPEVLTAAMLRHIAQSAAAKLESSIGGAVVTIPGCYDQLHRRAIRAACQIAGLDLVQLLDKPLAAGLNWYDVQRQLAPEKSLEDRYLLSIHLGGSAMEVALLHCHDGQVHQRLVVGDWRLGLQRWQARLAEYLASRLTANTDRSIREDLAAATRLQRTVELALDRLIRAGRVEVRFQWHDATVEEMLTTEQFLQICPDLSQTLLQFVHEVIAAGQVPGDRLHAVLLSGALLQMKPLQQCLRRALPKSATFTRLDETELARGAAVQAHYTSQLTTDERGLLHGFSCTAYDFAVVAGASGALRPRVVLPRGGPIPASFRKGIKLPKDASAGTGRHVVQFLESARTGGRDWRRLGYVDIQQAFPEFRPEQPLQLRLEVDESGIVESSVLWLPGNRQAHLTAANPSDLSAEQVRKWRHWLEETLLCAQD